MYASIYKLIGYVKRYTNQVCVHR